MVRLTVLPRVRKLALAVHLSVSVGWIGAVIGYLALGITAARASDTQAVRSAWIAMDITGWDVLLPLASAAFVTGVLLSLGTRWGLPRHNWVIVSLLLTGLALLVLVLHLPSVSATAEAARTPRRSNSRRSEATWLTPPAGSSCCSSS